MDIDLNLKNAELKDTILRLTLSVSDTNFFLDDIKRHLDLPNSFEEIKSILFEIQATNPEIAEFKFNEFNSSIKSNGATKYFLDKGGFIKIFNDTNTSLEKATKKEEKEVENLTLDITLKKWQKKTFWPLFFFAFIGFGLSVFNFITSLNNSKKEDIQKQNIEQMEEELEKLNISISNHERVDSLRNSKVSNNTENKKILTDSLLQKAK